MNFNEFDTYEILKDLFLTLNEENYTQFEFELVFIPIKKNVVNLNNGTALNNA